MNKIAAIVLVGLLGLLGCSDGDNGTTTVGEANPVAPFGIIDTTTPTYEWTPVPGATRYLLLVEDTDETPVIEEWYTAAEGGCASEDVLCIVTPDIEVIGENTWKIQSCANQECGLWSDGLQFSFGVFDMPVPCFTDNGDDTVTENNTKLIWTKDANLWGKIDWRDAKSRCEGLTLGGNSDWRLPDIEELKSSVDKKQWKPTLPLNHPFTNVQLSWYWSGTVHGAEGPKYAAWMVDFGEGRVGLTFQMGLVFVWCVR